jgi:hypothetical protein
MKTVFPILVACFPLQLAGGWLAGCKITHRARARRFNFDLTHFFCTYPGMVTLTSFVPSNFAQLAKTLQTH